jgi:ureidoglycolate lyase
MKPLHLTQITAEAFAPYGRLLSVDAAGASIAANQGSARRYDWAIDLENRRPHARLNVAVFRCAPRAFPFSVVLLERHAHSTQLFVPMTVDRYVVLVAGRGETPDLEALQGFIVPGTCGVAYAPGTWHHPMIALPRRGTDADSLFSASMWEDGSSDDCETVELPEGAWRRLVEPA